MGGHGKKDIVKLIQFAGRLIGQLYNYNQHTGGEMAVTQPIDDTKINS